MKYIIFYTHFSGFYCGIDILLGSMMFVMIFLFCTELILLYGNDFQPNIIFNFCCCAISQNYVYREPVLESLDEACHWPEAVTLVLAKSLLCCCTVCS